MKDLNNQYRFEADRLAEHAAYLREKLAMTEDINEINNLGRRIRLLEEERYEILRDIHDMKHGQSFSGNRAY